MQTKMGDHVGPHRAQSMDFAYFRTVDKGLTLRKGGRKPPFFIHPQGTSTT